MGKKEQNFTLPGITVAAHEERVDIVRALGHINVYRHGSDRAAQAEQLRNGSSHDSIYFFELFILRVVTRTPKLIWLNRVAKVI